MFSIHGGCPVTMNGYNKPKSEAWKKARSKNMSGENNPNYGKPAWNKGLKIQCNTGRTHFPKGYKSPKAFKIGNKPWNKDNKGYNEKEKHWNWQGGISEQNRTKRANDMQTFEYRQWRRNVFERDNYTCVECFTRGGYLEADHIKPYYKYPELRLEINNGRTLCLDCHRKYGAKANQYTVDAQ